MPIAAKHMVRRRQWPKRLAGSCLISVVALALCHWVIFPLPIEKMHRPHGAFVYSRDGHLLNCFTSPDQFWRKPITLAEVSPLLRKSVITTEDRWFYWHPGVNPISLVWAAIDNARAGRFVRGGSTLTMQIARMIEPKERTVCAKLVEIGRALQLELTCSKDELLELYLNLAPYGGNIEGIGAAAYIYFGKDPSDLSISEVAVLTAIPSSPTQFRPDGGREKLRGRRDRVLARLAEHGDITAEQYEQARAEEIPDRRIAPSTAAPHLCQTLASAYPGQTAIVAAADYKLQVTCERLARNYQSALAAKGIWNLSTVVIDNRTGDVLALVGSADFGDVAHQGQINGALAPRSPGSALKPFVYALAFENGLLTPERKVEDLPVNYSGYIPVNYDEQYHGAISATDALIQSFNVPAVNLTYKVGLQNFFSLLCRGGITTLNRKPAEYGLPLILGSGEVNLLELTNLYASLARGGVATPYHLAKSPSAGAPVRILSSQSCYLVTEILAELKRPDLPSSWEFTADMPKIAWKTGTSYGRKDAWAIGYNPEYTVGVWAGNFTAEGSAAIVGAEIAAPLMLDIFSQIYTGREKPWFAAPEDISTREVCAVSGQPTGEACPDKVFEDYIPGVSPTQPCQIHRTILVDANAGYQLCPACSRGRRTREVVVEEWPPRLASWFIRQGSLNFIPAHNPGCRGVAGGDEPIISSPEDDAQYVIRSSAPLEYQKILFEASAASDSPRLHWFLDGELFASAKPDDRVFYLPRKGRHKLLCVDTYGRSSSVSFLVQ